MADQAVVVGAEALRNFLHNPSIPDEPPKPSLNRYNEHPADQRRRADFLSTAPRAAQRLQTLRDQESRGRKLLQALTEEQMDLSRELGEANAQLRNLTVRSNAEMTGTPLVSTDHPSVTPLIARRDDISRRLADNERQKKVTREQIPGNVLTDIEVQLDKSRGRAWTDIEPIKPEADYETTVANNRRVDTETANVQNAPPSDAEVKAYITSQMDALAKKGEPDVATNGKITWATLTPPARIAVSPESVAQLVSVGGDQATDAWASDVWSRCDEIFAKLLAKVPKNAGGLSAAEKKTRLAALAEKKLRLEREECQHVWNSNGTLKFRPGCDYRAILAIE